MRRVVGVAVAALFIGSTAIAQQVFDVSMDGPQVPTASVFVGGGTVTLNAAETQITISLTHNVPNANVTDGHIHLGAAGVNGAVIFPFTGLGQNPINQVSNISPAQVSILKSGGYYVNIHTFAFPSGEIRGQVFPRSDVDQDLLPDLAETNTGTFVSSADTGTNPNDRDSDDDGVIDGTEVHLGTDPNSSGSVPSVPVGGIVLLAVFVGILIVSAGIFVTRRASKIR